MSLRVSSSPKGWLDRLDHVSNGSLIVLAGATMVTGFVIVGPAASTISVSRHLFYVPIVLVAVRFGVTAGVGTAIVAALLAGPVAGPTDIMIWTGRGAAFVLIGLIVGGFSTARLQTARVEADIAERERALVSQRVALVQIISHELRTPLTVLLGSVETLLERDALVDPEGRKLVLAMERAVHRLQDMVDVALATTDELQGDVDFPEQVDVAALVEHAVASLSPRLRQRLELDIPAGASLVTAESPLWLTLRCLLDNADKFSPEGGVVRVRYLEADGLAVISVEDDGPGLPEGFGDEAFEPFVQGDATERRSHPGLGMGLYTARRLARRLGGDVVVTARDHAAGSLAQVRIPKQRTVTQ